MKATFKIVEWNHDGFEQILCSSGAQKTCEQIGEQIKARANAELRADDTPGFVTRGEIVKAYGSNRWMQFVHTTDAATMFAERDEQILSRAVK